MNQQKLNNYTLFGSVHTAQIKTSDEVSDVQDSVDGSINVMSSTKADGKTVTAVINPNKLVGDCFKFSEFQTVVDTILAGAGIKNYQFTRADMRFDSYDPSHYTTYAKLNRYLISALAVTYRVQNVYRTTDLFTDKQLSVAIKNDYFQCENYNRAAKSEITHNTKEIFSCCQLLPWISAPHLGQVMTMRPLPRGTRHTVRQLGQVKYLCSLSRLRDRACRRG